MTALIVTKPTNLEQHGDVIRSQIRRGYLTEDNITELEVAHAEHYRSLEKVRALLAEKKVPFDEVGRGDDWSDSGQYKVVYTVGGDGTLLSASHSVDGKTPVIGIRSSKSSVGYLCAGGEEEIGDLVDAFLSDSLGWASCARLKASIFYAEEDEERTTIPILNDFLFANHNPSATTRYIITHGDASENHKSSGIWISTATGSTAGICAAGGRPMHRTDDRFQYQVRELYRGVVGSFRLTGGFFDPDELPFTIENRNGAAVLALDGQRGVIPLKFGDRINFQRALPIRIALPLPGT